MNLMKSERMMSQLVIFIATAFGTVSYFLYNKITYENFSSQEFMNQGFGLFLVFMVAHMFLTLGSSLILQNYAEK